MRSSIRASGAHEMSEHVLSVKDLRVRIRTEDRELTVVDGVSFDLTQGQTLCVVGESGSGKSVTMLSVLRLLDDRVVHYEGTIHFQGSDLLTLPARDLRQVRGRKVAMIFQDPMTALNPVYPVGWQIAEQLRAHGEASGAAAGARAVELLRTVGIPDPGTRVSAYPHELSGGMRQRVMIALALSCNPKVLIADEPTTALDVTIQAQILALINELKQSTGMAVVLVTHDMGVVAEMADRVIVMYGGRVVEEGPVADVFNRPQHPYTWGLLGSIPRLDLPAPARLPSIPGVPAKAGPARPDCVFAPRCQHRFDACALQPALAATCPQEDVADSDGRHAAACHLTAEQRARLWEAQQQKGKPA
jgi:peptide/nickel transport system ATP-binding protein